MNRDLYRFFHFPVNEIHVQDVGIPAARQAHNLEPADPLALTLLGRGYSLLNETITAELLFKDALEVDASYAPAYYYFGLLKIAQGEMDAAEEYLQQAAEFAAGTPMEASADDLLRRYFP